MMREKGFTLIELIIVMVIIAILALLAIPRYFANVGKATKARVYSNLNAMREAMVSYYTVYGAYPGSFPVIVTVDGEIAVNLGNPSNANWSYTRSLGGSCIGGEGRVAAAYKQPGGTC